MPLALLSVWVTFKTGTFLFPVAQKGGRKHSRANRLFCWFCKSEWRHCSETARLCSEIRLVCSLQNLVSKKWSWHAADDVSPVVIPLPAVAFSVPTSGLTWSRCPVNLNLRNLHWEKFMVKQSPIIKQIREWFFSLQPYVELDWLEKVRKIFYALNAFGRKLCAFWESVPKGRAEGKRERPCAFR